MTAAPIFDPDEDKPVGGVATPVAAPASDGGGDAPPDFIPMSLDDARALLVREHDVAIGKDDPLLMEVTLHQAFLADFEKLLNLSQRKSNSVLLETGNSLAEVVENTLDSLKEKSVQDSIKSSFGLMTQVSEEITQLKAAMRRHRRWVIGMTFLSILACAVAVVILASVLR